MAGMAPALFVFYIPVDKGLYPYIGRIRVTLSLDGSDGLTAATPPF